MNIAKVDSLAKFLSDKYNRVAISDAKGLIRLLCFEPKQSVPMHRHPKGDEYFYVIEGKGKVTIGYEETEVESNYVISAPADVPHQWKSGSRRLILLSIIIPSSSYELAEEATKMELI